MAYSMVQLFSFPLLPAAQTPGWLDAGQGNSMAAGGFLI